MTFVATKQLTDLVMALSKFKSRAEYDADIDNRFPLNRQDSKFYRDRYKAVPLTTVTVQPAIPGMGSLVTVQVTNNPVVSFYLMNYPACCGAKMIHHFACGVFTVEQLEPILDRLIYELRDHGYLRTEERVIVMMVETGRGVHTIDAEVQPVANPEMMYKPLWEYFHRQRKVNTRLMYNVNSGNVLHDMEVILK